MEYDADCGGAFCKTCEQFGKSLGQISGVWTTNPFTKRKKVVQRMRDHARSDQHSLAIQAAISNQSVSVTQQLHNVAEKERKMKRDTDKFFVRCAHFLARQHIAHTNSEMLVELVVSVRTLRISWKELEEMLCTLHM